MSITAVENTMSALAVIAFFAVMAMLVISLLAWSARLAGSRALARPVTADAGRTADAEQMLMKLAHDPFAFLFDRRLPAAAAGAATRRSAQESVVSADGALSIKLSSPSRREVEIALTGDQPPGTIAVVHVTDELSDRTILVPLSGASASPTGLALLATTSRRVGISRDVKLMRDTDLAAFSAADISQSVRASAGPTRERWQQLAAEVGAETMRSVITSALKP